MCSVKLFTTTLALAVPAIMWPPRPVRAETVAAPVALVAFEAAAQLN
jgi:hypothetical protein